MEVVMKYQKMLHGLILTLLPMLLPIMAAAQMSHGDRIAAQVPFEFVVANKVVPAGRCIVQTAPASEHILTIRNLAATVNLFSPALTAETKKAAAGYALVFNKYGDRYFLTRIKLAGSRTMYRLPENKAEAELRARNVSATEEIVLAALQ
jgi:hypothetical protein